MRNKRISDTDFKGLINNFRKQNEYLFENLDIEIHESIAIDILEKTVVFKNCNFKGERIDFFQDNSKTYEVLELPGTKKSAKVHKTFLKFENCTFENDLIIKDCRLRELVFSNVKITSKSFHVANSSINLISFNGSPDDYNFIENLIISEIEDNKTYFDFRLNKVNDLKITDSFISESWINKNNIGRINVDNSVFENNFDLMFNNIENKCFFQKCEFNNIDIKSSVFNMGIEFIEIVFRGKALFENSSNLNMSELKFSNINFEKQVSFESSNLFFLKLESVFFKEIVSFQNLKCEYIEIDKTHFDKVCYFNDLTIKSPEKCSLSTIRTIKNQLIKTENKIDYIKFNAVEFNLLIKDKNTTTSDLILLILNKNSSDFGTNWTKGIWFTFKNSLYFFIVLLIVNTFLKSNYPLCINYKNEFANFSFTLNYFLKFIFNLGLNDKEIQSNGWLYLIFIFAKILIGYGIYQTIQAFRKYGK